jgi:hypothetical protein
MTEREIMLNIIDRLQRKIYYKDDNCVEFDGIHESIIIEFDEDGFVKDIY